jgi:hypothetical protein
LWLVLRFTNVSHFSLSDVAPIVTISAEPLTYRYHNTPTDLKDLNSRRTVGNVFVSIELGE